MRFIDKILAPFQTAMKHSLESFVRLETADDEVTLAAADGSLVTYVKVDGSRQIIGEEEYNFLIEGSTIKIGSRFDRLVDCMRNEDQAVWQARQSSQHAMPFVLDQSPAFAVAHVPFVLDAMLGTHIVRTHLEGVVDRVDH